MEKKNSQNDLSKNLKEKIKGIFRPILFLYCTSFIGALLILGPSEVKAFSGWDRGNSPSKMKFFTRNTFKLLPLKGFLKEQPWSGDYWPTHKGGVSYRWASPARIEKNKWMYKTPGKGVVPRNLSPIEKYDLYLGNKNFDLTNLERERTGIFTERKIPEWEGLCHSWAPATFLYENPQTITVESPEGKEITFYSSDIKALLTYHLHFNEAPKTKFLGSRCNLDFSELEKEYKKGLISKEDLDALMRRPECEDTNAGAFHVVLTNFVGRKNRSFIIDKTRDLEVWNQPVYGYESKILEERKGASEGSHPRTHKEITLETVVYYIAEVPQTFDLSLSQDSIEAITFTYTLEIDFFGRIIGGSWLSYERPDFIWTQNKPSFKGPFKELKGLYNLSTSY